MFYATDNRWYGRFIQQEVLSSLWLLKRINLLAITELVTASGYLHLLWLWHWIVLEDFTSPIGWLVRFQRLVSQLFLRLSIVTAHFSWVVDYISLAIFDILKFDSQKQEFRCLSILSTPDQRVKQKTSTICVPRSKYKRTPYSLNTP